MAARLLSADLRRRSPQAPMADDDDKAPAWNIRPRPKAGDEYFPFSPSASHGYFRSGPAVSPFPSVAPPDGMTEESEQMEDLCRNEFGLKLSKLRSRLLSLAEEQQSALDRFCAEASVANNRESRREMAMSFIMDLASTTELATDRFRRLLFKMQATFLATALSEKEKLKCDILRFEDEASEIEEACHRVEQEIETVNEEADGKLSEEKSRLELRLREELQACQICLSNSRSVVIIPCLHAHFCNDCVEAVQKSNGSCPTCRGTIRGTVPYFV